jgi:alkyldihydroxyacetonephosphate synthase
VTSQRAYQEAIDHFVEVSQPIQTSTDPVDLLAYSHDAYPLALKAARRGLAAHPPQVVAFPATTMEVQHVVRAARESGLPIVPYGGGSGIVGGALAVDGGVVVETKRLSGLRELDALSGLARFGAGTNGQRLEDALNEHGLTCGHYPQSLRSSTVGGWIAHRASGSASTQYGGIEHLVAGLEVVLPSGDVLELRPVPRTASGVDLRQLFLGAEGTLGIVTTATLRVWDLPAARRWTVLSFGQFEQGLEMIRRVVRGGLRPAVVRLYDAAETAEKFGAEPSAENRCVLLLSSEGDEQYAAFQSARMQELGVAAGGQAEAQELADAWWSTRFDTPGLLATLSEPTGIADALEIAAPWSRLSAVYHDVLGAMTTALAQGRPPTKVYGHCSHAYPDGANVYMVFHGHARSESAVADLYQETVAAALRACAGQGGTISHHHGIGLGKANLMELEYGSVGLDVLRGVQRAIDPGRLFNPGKLGDLPVA